MDSIRYAQIAENLIKGPHLSKWIWITLFSIYTRNVVISWKSSEFEKLLCPARAPEFVDLHIRRFITLIRRINYVNFDWLAWRVISNLYVDYVDKFTKHICLNCTHIQAKLFILMVLKKAIRLWRKLVLLKLLWKLVWFARWKYLQNFTERLINEISELSN